MEPCFDLEGNSRTSRINLAYLAHLHMTNSDPQTSQISDDETARRFLRSLNSNLPVDQVCDQVHHLVLQSNGAKGSWRHSLGEENIIPSWSAANRIRDLWLEGKLEPLLEYRRSLGDSRDHKYSTQIVCGLLDRMWVPNWKHVPNLNIGEKGYQVADVNGRDFVWENTASNEDRKVIENYWHLPTDKQPSGRFRQLMPWMTYEERSLFVKWLRCAEKGPPARPGISIEFEKLSDRMSKYLRDTVERRQRIATGEPAPNKYRSPGISAEQNSLSSAVGRFTNKISDVLRSEAT